MATATDDKARVIKWLFHWNPLKPVYCIGGWVHFGWYAVVEHDGVSTLQTASQVDIKRDMGLIE